MSTIKSILKTNSNSSGNLVTFCDNATSNKGFKNAKPNGEAESKMPSPKNNIQPKKHNSRSPQIQTADLRKECNKSAIPSIALDKIDAIIGLLTVLLSLFFYLQVDIFIWKNVYMPNNTFSKYDPAGSSLYHKVSLSSY